MSGNYANSNAYYFYSFDRSDLRRDYALNWASYPNNGTAETIRGDMLNIGFNKWNFFWTTDSWKQLLSTATNRLGNGINWIIMRYPDVLLMYAEARNELHGPDQVSDVARISAREALEMVRTRAFGEGSPQIKQYDNDFFEAIVNERAWEFGGESIRKMDLIRWGILDLSHMDRPKARHTLCDFSPFLCLIWSALTKVYDLAEFQLHRPSFVVQCERRNNAKIGRAHV